MEPNKIWKRPDKTNNGWDPSNTILKGEGFFISYDPNSYGAEATALVKMGKSMDDTYYYILNGDFREEYEKLIDKGFEVCKQFFDEHKEHKSFFQ